MLFSYALQPMTVIGTLLVTYSIFVYSGTAANPVESCASRATES